MKKRIAVAAPVFLGNEAMYVRECLETGWISSNGKFIEKFETCFREYCGVSHAISCCNGTAALHLALLALGVGPGDEVIVPTLTYIASANAVVYCGGRPVFVDSEPRTMNLDPRLIERSITEKTKGIVVVHLFGHMADMEPIMEIAKKHDLFIVEDAAEAIGAQYKGAKAGTLGDIATFSFYGNKIISTGEGGMAITERSDLAEKMRLFRGQGMSTQKRYWFNVVGFNYRMTNIEAAIGLGQLEEIEQHLNYRRRLAKWYDAHLSGLGDFLELPVEEKWAHHSYWMYTVLLKESVSISRDSFMKELSRKGIETRPVFYPMHTMPPYAISGTRFPIAEHLAKYGVTLPTHAMLTEDDVEFIAEAMRKTLKE